MQKFLTTFKQAFISGILMFSLIFITSLSGLFIVTQQASYATTREEIKLIPPEYKPNSEEKINRAYEYDPGVGIQEEERQKAYEQAVKDAESLDSLEKAYERNLKAEKAATSPLNLAEKAKKGIEKVTGK